MSVTRYQGPLCRAFFEEALAGWRIEKKLPESKREYYDFEEYLLGELYALDDEETLELLNEFAEADGEGHVYDGFQDFIYNFFSCDADPEYIFREARRADKYFNENDRYFRYWDGHLESINHLEDWLDPRYTAGSIIQAYHYKEGDEDEAE
ncbi:hypothetical protein [Turicimonas muris]|uniref:hypothetical protein n=1 Tax=Turicimonas muris TaxID=1796652 RepID=UPI0032B13714